MLCCYVHFYAYPLPYQHSSYLNKVGTQILCLKGCHSVTILNYRGYCIVGYGNQNHFTFRMTSWPQTLKCIANFKSMVKKGLSNMIKNNRQDYNMILKNSYMYKYVFFFNLASKLVLKSRLRTHELVK
jgi:hypothetical protein